MGTCLTVFTAVSDGCAMVQRVELADNQHTTHTSATHESVEALRIPMTWIWRMSRTGMDVMTRSASPRISCDDDSAQEGTREKERGGHDTNTHENALFGGC